MKIIDLLNKIANKENIPKKIRYDNQVFEYREDMLDYYCYDYDLNLMGYQKILNDTVEIIEEQKKIPEKLNIEDDGNTITLFGEKENEWTILDNVNVIICNKINSIIDYLKSKGE